jgi:16S rRNA (cytidine1402-2'-O)-methyltransferase
MGSSRIDEEAESKPLEARGKSATLLPGLYILATPIGNARDISLRALDALKACDAIAAEDTRVIAKLLAIHGISRPLLAYNDHNGAQMRPRILARLKQGERLVLVSDAGTPLVADPGFKLVRAAIEQDLPVFALPGPSAALAGLMLAGLPSDRFLFAGFLPSRAGERDTVLAELKSVRATLIFFESPQRLGESLAAMARQLGMRAAVVAREVTKLHEEVRRGTLADLAAHYEKTPPPKGEVTLLVSPPHDTEADTGKIDMALAAALPFMPVKAAAEMIASLTGTSKKQVYDRALALKEAKDG